jgi:hypothetical protein
LTTPVDEDAFLHQGIHERLEIAEKMGDYFGEAQLGMMKSVVEADIKTLDKFKAESTVALSQPEMVSSWEDG